MSKTERYNGARLISAKQRRLFSWLIALVMYYLFSYLVDPLNSAWSCYSSMSIQGILGDILITILYCIIIAEASLAIDGTLNRSLSWHGNARKRLLLQTLFQILAGIMIVLIIYRIFDYIFRDESKQTTFSSLTTYAQGMAVSIAVSLVISAFNTGEYFLYNWMQTATEATEHKLRATEHKQAAMAAELQALKLQIDPHFIFNNLSVLSELILENQQLGYEYSENFAKVYRYLLINSKKDVIPLTDELKFLDSYVFLTRKRIGDGLDVRTKIHSDDLKFGVPPMALQLLVENAIKHNQTTRANPLMIHISSVGNRELMVTNTLIPLINKSSSGGIGLDNIVNRYALLSDKNVEIRKTPESFIVKIPLLSW